MVVGGAAVWAVAACVCIPLLAGRAEAAASSGAAVAARAKRDAAALASTGEEVIGALLRERQAPAFRAAVSGDPLVDWLHSLKINLGDIEESKLGVTFKATDIICSELAVARVESTDITPAEGDPSFGLALQGLGIVCKSNWSLSFPPSGGTLSAEVVPGASATVALTMPLEGSNVPQRVEVPEGPKGCDAKLDFKVNIDGGLTGWILDWILPLITGKIKSDAVEKTCSALRDTASQNATAALHRLNAALLPPAEPASGILELPPAADVQAGPPGSFDWTQSTTLARAAWLFHNLLGPAGMDRALQWALNGTGRVELPGSEGPLLNLTFELSGSRLGIAVVLDNATLDGVDGIRSLDPITAENPSDLAMGLALGTPQRPAVAASTRLNIRISAYGEGGDGPVSQVDQPVTIALGLGAPALSARLRLLLSQAQVVTDRTLGQWWFGAEGCMRDLLMASPQLQALQVNFTNVTEPLNFTAEDRGQLEIDLAAFANHMVGVFNRYYLRYLPAAITRAAASQRFRETVNSALARTIRPSPPGQRSCITATDAAARAAGWPQFLDWRTALGGKVRQAIDNATDGFLHHNETDVGAAFAGVRPFSFQTNEVALTLQPQELNFSGLSNIKELRALLPSADDAQALWNRIAVACPANQTWWRPSMSAAAILAAPSRGAQLDGQVCAELPCGHLDVMLHAQLDVHSALALSAPPSLHCVLAPFEELAVHTVDAALGSFGKVLVGLQGEMQHQPIQELCEDYHRLCERIAGLGHRTGGVAAANHALDSLVAQARHQCLPPQSRDGEPAPVSAPDPSDGVNPLALTLASAGVSVVLCAAMVMTSASVASRHPAAAGSDGLSRLPLAAHCWASKSVHGRVMAVGISWLLSAALVLRTVSIFWCNVADSYATIDAAGLGGEVIEIDLITFTFFGMVSHYWDAKAYLTSFLLTLNSFIIAYIVILVGFLLWLTPAIFRWRRAVVRLLMYFSRFPFVDVVFFSHVIPILSSDIPFPLGITAHLRSQALSGIYVGVASSLCFIVAIHAIRGALPPLAMAPEAPLLRAASGGPPRIRGAHVAQVAMGVLAAAGWALWVGTPYFRCSFKGLAGDVMDPKVFSGGALAAATSGGSAFLGGMLVLMMGVAPLVQAAAAVAGGALRGKPLAMTPTLGELGCALCLVDVFTAGFIAIVLEIDEISAWIVSNRFGGLCDAIQAFSGAECIGVQPSFAWTGCLGLFIALVSCTAFLLSLYLADVRSTRRNAGPREGVPSQSFQSIAAPVAA